jgi:hypothetical protein
MSAVCLLLIIKQPWRLLYSMAHNTTQICGVIRYDPHERHEIILPLPQLIEPFQQYFLSYSNITERLHHYKRLCHFNPTYLDRCFKTEFQNLLCFDT